MATRKAVFCMATGVPPSEYDELTVQERTAFLAIASKRR